MKKAIFLPLLLYKRRRRSVMQMPGCNTNKPIFDADLENSSDEFKNGNYEKRIGEAVQYLIDYFPKAKPQQMEPEQRSAF